MINKYHILLKSKHEGGKTIISLEEKRHDDYHGEHEAREYYRCEDVDEIIKVMLVALIELAEYGDETHPGDNGLFLQAKKAIEKATGKTWEEISE